MSLPYQGLSRLGQSSILCAAKGPSIQTFNLDGAPSFLSSWTHPLAKQVGNGQSQGTGEEGQDLNEQESGQPPSKKRKLAADEKPGAEAEDGKADGGAVEATANGKGRKKQNHASRGQGPELPFVALMAATEDAKHLVAVTGQDKTLWVFEHNGNGVLKELSKRAMPKRPSSIAITADGRSILSADKFGDVYSLPLIPSAEDTNTSTPTPTTPSTPTPTAPSSAPLKPAANRFTVHSQRNLRALEEQERILAARKAGALSAKESGRPAFEHEPILGHVSMLTAVAVAHDPDPNDSSSGRNRPYIVTADRDEHVRVSRGAPQAHVIETYCLGHESFVSALCVPASRPEVLVSGGGDDELFVWEWKVGRLMGRVDVLGRVKEVLGDEAGKVAVARLSSYEVGGGCYVFAVCELVPAIFIFQLVQDTLEHVQTLNVPGIPLDAVTIPNSEGALRLVVAVDAHRPSTDDTEMQGTATEAESPQSLLLFERDEAGNWSRQGGIQGVADGNIDISREELENILYPVGKLRKTEFEDEEAE